MTRTMNARVAGFTFLFYIVAGLTCMNLNSRASGGPDPAARLEAISRHPTEMAVVVILLLFQCFSALVLAVTLHALTRETDRDLAMMGLLCRAAEGIIGGAGIAATLEVVDLARTTGAGEGDLAARRLLGAHLLREDIALTATFFALGSLLFSYLLLRGRLIPAPLAWLGVGASVLLVVELPLQLAGFVHGPITRLVWLPMLAFEVPLGFLLLIKGVR
ncbi:MAG: DUF4386 domain-containing protein [Thermoanaerobaculia bacterium]